jgi:chorismate mutase
MTGVRGIRGATSADTNSKEAILEATTELLGRLVEANDVDLDDVAAAYFTATDDLNAEFPALAARQMGWTETALMCAREMNVEDGAKRCIRVLLLVNTDKALEEIEFVYLKRASNLRSRGTEEV